MLPRRATTRQRRSSASGVCRSGAEGGVFSCALFFWADGERGNTDVLAGGL